MSANVTYDTKAKFLAQAKRMGALEAQGKIQSSEFLVQTAVAVQEGAIGSSIEDAGEAWAAYRTAQTGEALTSKGKPGNILAAAGVVDSDAPDDVKSEANFKQRRSALRSVMLAAALPSVSFVRTLGDARSIIVEMRAAKTSRKNTFDGFVAIANAQRKVPDRDLSEDEIRETLLAPVSEDKEYTEQGELERIKKELERLIAGTADKDGAVIRPAFPSAEAKAALDRVDSRLAAVMA